jgi:hypothetical protein
MKNTYEKLFDEFLDLTEFRLVKHKDGMFSLEDRQCANLGDIEEDRFTSASEILDRMDVYIQDYLIADIEDALDEKSIEIDCDWEEYGKYRDLIPDYKFDFDLLDMIVNHSDKVDLRNCDYLLTD